MILINMQEKTWVKVASSVTSGIIRLPESEGAFSFKYVTRKAGDSAPVAEGDFGLVQPMFEGIRYENILSGFPIDVYVWAENADPDASDMTKLILDF